MSIRYFLPDWNDRVDPSFEFSNDSHLEARENADGDQYAHEILGEYPYDGLLVSRAVVEKGKSRFAVAQSAGVHKMFRVPADFPILGDCGAFSYVEQDIPPYDTADVLEYYNRIGVTHGVSVDHLIFDSMTDAQKKQRRSITLKNARDFISGHTSMHCRFTPIGVAQGWDPDTYADSIRQLLEMGYSYLALGGLARSTGPQIIKVLEAVDTAIKGFKTTHNHIDHVDLHVFGVAKLDWLTQFRALGVTSIDSASHFRKAWLRSGQNYLTESGKWYTAVRVPQSSNKKVKQYVAQNGRTMPDVLALEARVLSQLQQYSRRELQNADGLKGLLDMILDYDEYLLRAGDDGQSLRNKGLSRKKYQQVLEDRPWETCRCKICSAIGVDVVIFRGTNRNKRRGFHNVWAFYQRLKAILG